MIENSDFYSHYHSRLLLLSAADPSKRMVIISLIVKSKMYSDTAHCYVESLFDGMDFSTNVTRARFDNELSKVNASCKN